MSTHLQWQVEHLIHNSLLTAGQMGNQLSNVDLCSWCRACECTDAQPLAANGQRPQAPGPGQVRMGAAHHAQERRRVRPGEQAGKRCVAGLRHPRRMQEQEVQLWLVGLMSIGRCGMCSICKSYAQHHGPTMQMHETEHLVSQWTRPKCTVFRPMRSNNIISMVEAEPAYGL
jgi:hypothetical protein